MKIEIDVDIPEGYEATGECRLGVMGEVVVGDGGTACELDYITAIPRIILRKKKRKVIVFVQDPDGDFFMGRDLQMERVFAGATFMPEWRYRREEREE